MYEKIALARESGNGGFFPPQSVGYPLCLDTKFCFHFFSFPLERSSNLFRFTIRLLRSFLAHFIFFEASVSRFAHAHFEPLLCDLLVCSKVSLSAVIILLTIPTKATRGRVLNFHSVLLQLPHLTGSPDSHNVSSPCQLYELLRASARVLTCKIRAQKYVLQPRGQWQSAG